MSARQIELSLPDGTTRSVPEGTTPLEVARGIGSRLAAAALGARLDGQWVDLRAPLARGGAFRVVTARDADADEVIRHSAEHVMADAVKRLWPGTQIDVGRTDHSEKFQYDFDIPARIGPDDLERIEAEMRRIVAADQPFERRAVGRDEARRLFESLGEGLKLARLDDIPEGQEITVFGHGDFVDLCRGPHVQRTGQIGAFKLTEIAGSYWKGDERNKMLQRIYGVAFRSQRELDAWLAALEEARRRDHRRLGAELELFAFHEWSPGSPFYLPKGLRLFNALVEYVRGLYLRHGYQEVMCPLVFDAELFKVSGHYENFRESMFWMPGADEGEEVGLKPMNCPGHCLLFRSQKRSYRELPLRFAEFSRLHRNERSGTLHGLARVRAMSQDDAHCYCEPERLHEEVDRIVGMVVEVYRDFALGQVDVCVATRPERSIGDPAEWERAERMLWDAVERAGFACRWNPGEGAFYGPKIEFHFKDALARSWQLSTVQLDLAMPERFGLRYVGRDGAEHQPAMIHRALLGSLERFMGIYLEHTAGDFPLWLAPVQAAVLPVAERHEGYARKLVDVLVGSGLRCELDARNETLGYRVRAAETQKIPFVLVAGDREQADSTVTVRRRHREGQSTMGVDQFRSMAEEEVRTRGIS
jgi:threonyl-tRNA synthetase